MFRERFSYDPLVLPFLLGLIFIVTYLALGAIRMIKNLPAEDKIRLGKSFFSKQILLSIREIFNECLLHLRIFKKNPVLGYMHMSIALGWFMMIVLAHVEVKLYAPSRFNLPYYPIFFRYFVRETQETLDGAVFFFLMDFFLLMVLSGVGIAMYKRFNSKATGLRRTTRLKWNDRIALYALWSIFPLRLLAESFTSGISGGSFLTRGFGMVFETFVSNDLHVRPTWWAYSLALGTFFFTLPFSRFMHIPTEMLLILFRNAGIKHRTTGTGIAQTEIYSCSRCGICIDACQMVSAARLENKATVYFIRELREGGRHNAWDMASACLMCRRCVEACPVKIESTLIRSALRQDWKMLRREPLSFLPVNHTGPARVIYFAGCMSHLTPGIEQSMVRIFEKTGTDFTFMDREGGICCGRPMMLAGETRAARELIDRNKKIILHSGADTLVTSCPICYRVFAEEYQLPLKVQHHSQFILQMMEQGKISPEFREGTRVVYHDPCELGRNSGIYEEPRKVIAAMARIEPVAEEREMGLCCGGHVGSISLTHHQRRRIAVQACNILLAPSPDAIVTACPLCKKTLMDATAEVPVVDIAQMVDNPELLRKHPNPVLQ
jgi:Fe-S oxidoreductase